MSSPPQIDNLKELLEPYLDGAKLIDYTTKYLTKPGDNYGSTILALSAKIQNGDKEPTILELVAKIPPETAAFFQMFQVPLTSIKENETYFQIIPTLINLQKEANVPESDLINVFPNFFGARISLHSDARIADMGALLILENLKVKGFDVGDRLIGFDEDTSLLVLKNLAVFHALPIALRYLHPTIYNKNVKPFLNKIDMFAIMPDTFREHLFNSALEHIESVPAIAHLGTRIKEQMKVCVEHTNSSDNKPFATIVHNDFWLNNMMIRHDSNGMPEQIKIVDFQITIEESLIHDLIFFLFTSIQMDILSEKFDEFMDYYYHHFYKCLEQMGCPLNDFGREKFNEEIEREAPLTLLHIIIMLKVVMTRQDCMPKEFKDMSDKALMNKDLLGPEYFVKLREVLILMDKKGWIQK